MHKKKVLIPIPSYGFDPTEVAIPWKILSENNFEIVFITPNGKKGITDKLMLTGERLGIWKPFLQANSDAKKAFNLLDKDKAFCNPYKYSDIQEENFDALLLPGGHDKGVKEYLESKVLKDLVSKFFANKKPIAAICHGVILAARSIDSTTGKSVLYNYKTTALLKFQEKLAYHLTRFWLKDYYLTYPGITVEEEVKSILLDKGNFIEGGLPVYRDSIKNTKRGFVVRDKNYLSARWPGDAHRFSMEFVKMINEY